MCCVVFCAVVVCCPPRGGACCAGAWPPSWWGVLCWGAVCCVVWRCLVCGGGVWPSHGGACCVGVWSPSFVGRAAFGCGVLCCVALCCVWWCVAPRMVGCAALVCAPPQGGACCGGVWPPPWRGVLCRCSGSGSCRFSRLDARLVLLVRCCLRHLTAGVVRCRVYVSFARPGRTGRPPERVQCATPCFCFVGVVPCHSCSPAHPPLSCVSAAPGCALLFGAACCCAPPPTPPHPSACCPLPPLCFLVSPRLPAAVTLPPFPGGFFLSAVGVSVCLFPCPLCALWLLCAAWPFVGAFCSPLPHPWVCVSRVSSPCRLPPSVLLLLSRGFAPLGRWTPPPVLCSGVLLVLPCAGWCWRAVLACCVLCGPVLLLAVLCCPGCGVPCRVVPCLVVLRGGCGAALRFLVRLRAAACFAVLGGAVRSCRALHRSLGCCVLVLSAVLTRCKLLWVALCRLCCAFGRRVWFRCAGLSSLWFAVSTWSLCCALCCASWCCAGPCRVVLCCVVQCCCALCCGVGAVLGCLGVCGAASCCGVPSGAVQCLGCFVLCCVLCRCVLCCALGCGVLLPCDVLFVLCLAVLLESVFLCVVLCLLLLCCAALRRVGTCGAVLLRTVPLAWCCAGFSPAFWCGCVLCPALECCAVLWNAVPFGFAVCCVALCCVRCAVCVLPLCCGVCCFFCYCLLRCWRPVASRCVRGYLCAFSKTENLFPANTCCALWCRAVCCLPSLHATIPHTIKKTSLLDLFLSGPRCSSDSHAP